MEELFISSIAGAIDEAIGWLDQNATAEEHVCLLTVPASHLYAFWLEDDELKSRLTVIDATGSRPDQRRDAVFGLARIQLHGESEFLHQLSLAAEPAGVLLAGNRVLTRA